MKKLYLHIGTEKTGTTTLQEVLFQNKESLKNEGFHFLQSAGVRNNRKIPAYCMDDDNYDDFFKDLRIDSLEKKNQFRAAFLSQLTKEIQGLPVDIHSVIISSEHLHSRTRTIEEIRNVKALLSNFFSEIKVICYVREQAATAVSLYSTDIKCGDSPSLKEVLSDCHPNNVYYNYYEMLSNWSDVFGLENLMVQKFDRCNFRNGDLIDDFLGLIDSTLEKTIDKNIETQNESLTVMGQFLGRAINKALPKYGDNGLLNPMRGKAIQAVYQSFKGKGETISVEDYEEIYASFVASNVKLNEKFLHGAPGESCFEKRLPKVINTNDATLQESEIEKLTHVFSSFSSNSLNLPNHYADFFKDLALSLERKDLKSAHTLMELAHMVRPSGPFIKEKLTEYEDTLSKKSKAKQTKPSVFRKLFPVP